MRIHLLSIFFLIVAILAGFLVSHYPPDILVLGCLALTIFIISFVKIEWGLYLLIFSMLLSPELNISGTAGASLGRGITLRFEDFLLVVIGLSWFAKNAVNKELGLFLKTPLNKAILFYALACLLSTGFGIFADRVDAKIGLLFVLKYIEYFIIYFMIVNHVKDKDQIKRLIFCLFLTCFIVSIIGIIQIPGGGRTSAPFEGEIGEPNTLGGYLLFIGAIAAGLIIKSENQRLRILLLILIFTMVPAFLFTQSRSSYLGLVPTCFAIGLLTKRKIIAVGLITVAFLLSPLLLPSQVKDRILYTFTQPERSDQVEFGGLRLDTSTSARLISLKEILTNWPKHPIVGYGVTGYGFTDSQFPRILIETGIVGLIAFIYLLYSIFKLAINRIKDLRSPEFKGLALGFFVGFVGLLFHSFGANTFIIVRIMEPFWFLAGIVAVLPALECQSQSQADESAHRARKLASATRLSS